MSFKNKIGNSKGTALVAVLAILVVMMILTPALVRMVQQETKLSVQSKKNSTAYQLADAAVSQGVWKLKNSTTTFAAAAEGTVITDYNFDRTFEDIEGGQYRIRFSSGPGDNEVTITAEGRDKLTGQTRAIQQTVENRSVPGAVLSMGNVNMEGNIVVHWGPVMSQSSILLDGTISPPRRYPRKLAGQVVRNETGNSSYNRDTNGLTPPNTDNKEWWSDYPVVEMPLFDFATLRSSAAASTTLETTNESWNENTLNYYRNRTTPGGSFIEQGTNTVNFNFIDPGLNIDTPNGHVWYWDGDLTLDTSDNNNNKFRRATFKGTMIVMGDLTLNIGDNLPVSNAPIPKDAWKEYAAIDTSTPEEYPGDLNFQNNAATFDLGSETWANPPIDAPDAVATDVGLDGFLYVGGTLNFQLYMDIYGAAWVEGEITGTSGGEYCIIFYNDQIELPTLNVVLVVKDWREASPDNTTPWP